MYNRIVDIVLIVNFYMCFCVYISIVRFGFYILGFIICFIVFVFEGRF